MREEKMDAADWFALLRDPALSDDDKAAFDAWIAVAENAAAFHRISMHWERSVDLGADEDVRDYLSGLLSRPQPGAQTAPSDRLSGRFRTERRGKAGLVAGPRMRLAAAAALLAALMIGVVALNPSDHHRTAVGEQRVVALTDGSRVTLNTSSAISVRFERGERLIRLEKGEALFEVAEDALRPFIVAAGMRRVTAFSTEFAVRRQAAKITITLFEGAVSVAAETPEEPQIETLVPGDQLSYSEETGVTERTVADLEAAGAWTEGNLIFRDARLVDALAEVNRYHAHKITLGSSALEDIPVSGVFLIGETHSLVLALERIFDIKAIRHRNGDVVLVSAGEDVS